MAKENGKQEVNDEHEEHHEEQSEEHTHTEEVPVVEQPPLVAQARKGRLYYITLPIRPLSANVSEEHLDRLALYYTIYGIVFAIVGAVAIVLPLLFGVALKPLLAWALVVGGGVTLLQFILVCGAPGTTAFLLLGALHLGAGLWLLLQPIAGSTALTFVVSAWFLAHGFLKIIMAIEVRKVTTWPLVLVSGVASLILAFVILSLTPKHGTKLLGIAFGADLAFTGVSLLSISLMAFLGKGHRSVTDADAVREPLLSGGGPAAASA